MYKQARSYGNKYKSANEEIALNLGLIHEGDLKKISDEPIQDEYEVVYTRLSRMLRRRRKLEWNHAAWMERNIFAVG